MLLIAVADIVQEESELTQAEAWEFIAAKTGKFAKRLKVEAG